MLGKRDRHKVRTYMFIARITMAEGSNIKIGFHSSKVRESPKKRGKMRTCNSFNPDYTCVAVWLIVVGEVSECRQYDKEKRKSSRWPSR